MIIARGRYGQKFLKSSEDLKIVGLEALEHGVEHLLEPVEIRCELVAEWPRLIERIAMRPGCQAVRATLTCESEPVLGDQVIMRDLESGQDRQDLALCQSDWLRRRACSGSNTHSTAQPGIVLAALLSARLMRACPPRARPARRLR